MATEAPEHEGGTLSEVPLVGVGASAGGLEALKVFLSAMASHAGIACVVVQHLDPDHESMMAELLSRHTGMRVLQAEDGLRVEADHVYLIPPRKYIALEGERLRLLDPTRRRGHRMPIDHFFRSLAEARADRAMCVILSGTGSDGTLGLKAVKEVGGLTAVQAPDDAQHDGMPRSAIATDLVDLVMPAREIPRALLRYVRHPYFPGRREAPSEESTDEIERILRLLRLRRQHDFSSYKRGTLGRRIERRAGLLHLPDLEAYRARLEQDDKELDALQKDLLIGVTAFFRDGAAWEILERHVFPTLCERAGEDVPIRVWVPGTATGEEAYSIAILAYEQLANVGKKNCRVQVFATDIDTEALETARAGIYPESIEGDVSPERLSRFFVKEGGHYRIHKFLRESVTFAAQNVISDPPFSKVDLVSCRNLLIYLGSEVQRRVLELLHFALNPGGYLFLGSAEGVGAATNVFRAVHPKWRIYQRLPSQQLPALDFTATGRQAPGRAFAPRREPQTPTLRQVAERAVLEAFAPGAVLVNRNYEILQYVGGTGRWLEAPSGDPTLNILSHASSAIRSKLRSALHRVVRDGAEDSVAVAQLDARGRKAVRIHVRRVESPGAEEDLFLAAFEDVKLPASPPRGAELEGQPQAEQMIQELESELQATRDDLHSTIEQLEAANEELKASNEEVMSMNEELQSTNEELETSKEELQSLNEELTTVNSQLQEKVLELEGATNDLHNLLTSTDIATLFLDRSFRIKRFTPAIDRLGRVLPSDVGRPVEDLSGPLGRPELLEDARQVLARLRPVEREIETERACFLQRVLPYRTEDDRIDGVVVTFVDITERIQKERAQAELAAVADAAAEALLSQTPEGQVVRWGGGAERMYGYSPAEAEGRPVEELIVPADRRDELAEVLARVRHGETVEGLRTRRRRRDGVVLDVELSLAPIRDAEERVVAVASVARDVTEESRQEEALRLSEQRFETAIRGSSVTVFEQDRDLVYRWIRNPMIQRAPEEIVGHTDRELMSPEDAEALESVKREVLESGESRHRTVELELDGARRWFDLHVEPSLDGRGELVGIVATSAEVTETKRAEAALRLADQRKDQLLAVLGHELRNPLGSVGAAADALTLDHAGDERLERILAGVTQMRRLLDDLLTTARISEGHIELRRRPLDIPEVVGRASATTAHRFERSGARLERRLGPSLPALDADPERVHQILVNLLVNAIEHAGGSPHVVLSAEEREGVVRLCVEDDGPGLPREVLEGVFGDRPPEPGASLEGGIGLAVVRSLAELHGGRAWGEQGERGARLCVELPQASPSTIAAAAETEEARVDELTSAARRLLLVDDNRDMVESMAMLLHRHGFQVECATSAEEALAVAERWRPDLALVDIGLPDMSGYELSGLLRRLPGMEKLRLVAVSGWGQAEYVERSREAGFERHLVKPVDIATLRSVLGSGGR